MTFQELLDRPIAFQRAFVTIGVGITGALMLSQAIYWSNRTENAEGWFYKTMEEWEAETGMTRSEQESARKKLIKVGALEEMKKGVPCRLFYRVNINAIHANLSADFPQTSLQDSRKQGRKKVASKAAEIPQAITETTAEITPETTADTLQDAPASPGQPAAKVIALVTVHGEEPRCEIPADMPGPKDHTCKTFKVWANYAMAYRKRYSTWPVWNAKVGGQLGQLVDRLGADVAHHVAAHFLKTSDAAVLRKCHSLNELLVNAESYHTQWVTGQRINGTTARQMERTEANLSAAEQAAQLVLAKRQAGERNEYL
ncbi:phage replication protein [Pseudomonas rubra]|uniref:Phage replication protein n=1 Tax=Pseudomonas rubra TaxID=2942627 RepID=A0ABT5PF38_9PSED|nr:phage replication protein [Pseudomonas rubra]MDD1016883.1 phage replication protein [Pseudomonas rubra]MDD1039371.1 phage replication protein [Pseudomonas rubra]MDD1157847.1 phage replication protein [Pseudomonas rubra]